MPDPEAPELRIEYVPLDQLQAAPRNPKGHDDPGIDASMNRHGFLEPVLVDERTGRLVGGHGRTDRLAARKAQGLLPPARIKVADDGAWLVPTVYGYASPNDAEAEAALVALNRLVEAGGIADEQLLYAMLDELTASDLGLDGTGYSADDLDDLLASLGAGELPEQATDAEHADRPERGDPATPRELQGLREVGLMFSAEQHREYQALLAQLRSTWNIDPAPQVVLRAMREALTGG